MTSFTVHEKPTHAYVSGLIENPLDGHASTRSSAVGGGGRFLLFMLHLFRWIEYLLYASLF